MAYKYYYIDDDPLSTIKEIAKGLSSYSDKLNVEAFQHEKWGAELNFLVKNQDDFDGLLLDWGLTRKNEDGDQADFEIEALAQQIRRYSIQTKKFNKDFPIVLCSAKYQFSFTFHKETTSHDLFDQVYEKDTFDDHREKVINELIDLAKGYETLNNKLKSTAPLRSTLSILNEEREYIDNRLIYHLREIIGDNKPPHEVAKFLLKNVVKPQGLLIDKYLLAARLGIDIINDSDLENFNSLLGIISETKYKGIFSEGWHRWWMKKVLMWWKENFEKSLGAIPGPERVIMLNRNFDINLTPAKTSKFSKSEMFWIICSETRKPLAIEDAVIAASDAETVDWESNNYYSIEIALQKDKKEVDLTERDRLKKLKKIHTQSRRK